MTSGNKKLEPVVPRNILWPFIIITSLFALWGIANDLTNPMVSAFKKVMPELSNTQASLVQFAFYFGYFFMALPAALFIRKYSYKSGIVLGLAFYVVGAFLFYPAAQLANFNFYLISLWVITCGLAFLETTANPLVLALGDPETATRRLNLAQAFNPIGSLTGMLMAQVLVIGALKSTDYSSEAYNALSSAEMSMIRDNDLGVISLPYIGLGLFHRGPGRPHRILLLDGDGRADVDQGVDVRPVQLFDKHPRVGRERFNVPPLPLREEGVEGK